MMRLIMLVLFVAALLTLVTALINTAKAVAGLATTTKDDAMPITFKRIAYGLLVILLLGLTTGLLGAA